MMVEEGNTMDVTDMRDVADQEERPRRRRRRRMILTGALIAVCLVLAIVIRTSRNKKSAQPVYTSVTEENRALYEVLTEAMTSDVKDGVGLSIPTEPLLRVGSYQNDAFNWLAASPNLEDIDYNRKIQRFALACLYFATYEVATNYNPIPGPWVNDEFWLSEFDECTWSGVICSNPGHHVHNISMEHNELSGRLPLEVGLLWRSLEILELSFNGVTMEGDDWELFRYLPKLKKLGMSKNYVVSTDGLPNSLTSCPELRKILLTETMMGGTLDNGVLMSLQKMTHLEMEYNSFTGHLGALGGLPNLQQVYLRNNDFNSHLNFLKSPLLVANLTSIWIDGNDISEGIPTEIGKLTSLRSVSVSNAALTGTIPTEVGNLKRLERLWLYRNELTGTVPTELGHLKHLQVLKLEENNLVGNVDSHVCKHVSRSSYEAKGVAVDCDEVDCECCICF